MFFVVKMSPDLAINFTIAFLVTRENKRKCDFSRVTGAKFCKQSASQCMFSALKQNQAIILTVMHSKPLNSK